MRLNIRERIDHKSIGIKDNSIFYDSGKPFPYPESKRLMNVCLVTEPRTLRPVAERLYRKINEGGSGVIDYINPNLEIRIIGLPIAGTSDVFEVIKTLNPDALLIANTFESFNFEGFFDLAKDLQTQLLGYQFERMPMLNEYGHCVHEGEKLREPFSEKFFNELILADIPDGKELPHMYYMRDTRMHRPKTAQVFLHQAYLR